MAVQSADRHFDFHVYVDEFQIYRALVLQLWKHNSVADGPESIRENKTDKYFYQIHERRADKFALCAVLGHNFLLRG